MEGTSVHMLACALDKSVHSRGHIWRFLSRGVLHIMTYMGRLRPRERGTFLRLQVYKRVEISLAEVYERVGKCAISVIKKAPKD